MASDNQASVFLFRFSIFIGLLSAVVTVIYLTPVPELQHASCERPCHELDWPMICRTRIVLDMATLPARSCEGNRTDCDVSSCATTHARVLSANGLLPGPPIQVCERDILVVDVVNRVPGAAVTVHWRGQSQRETPFMDGVPMVTQCPINSFTTFQYKFRAANPGTHLWQVQSGNDALDTLFGALVVRQSTKNDPHHELYDEDSLLMLISELPTGSLLVNGLPLDQDSRSGFAHFNVTAQKRHRFRIAYAVTSLRCPISVEIERHPLLIIAIDGHPIRPVSAQSLQIAPGERVDVVLTADKELGDYRLTVATAASCSVSRVTATISYTTLQELLSTPSQHSSNTVQSLSTSGDVECSRTDLLCLPKIESLIKMPAELLADRLDFTLYLPFDFVKSSTYAFYKGDQSTGRLNNLSLTLPSSPLLTQGNDVDPETLCSATSLPPTCNGSVVCQCVHVIDIPLDAAVELVLIDQGGDQDHVFHLHGYSFHVVGATPTMGRYGLSAVKELDIRGQLLSRNLKNPVVKDTVAVPANGVVAIRFFANNPGYWLLHDDRPSHWSHGLGVILHVGSEDDVPAAPEQFPTCGSWVGPEFFLI